MSKHRVPNRSRGLKREAWGRINQERDERQRQKLQAWWLEWLGMMFGSVAAARRN